MILINNKENNKKLIKTTLIIAIGNLSTKAISFLLLPLYTVMISTKDYGTIDLLSTVSTLLTVIVGLELYNALFRFVTDVRDDELEIKRVFTNIWILNFFILVIFLFLFICIGVIINIKFKIYLLMSIIANVFLYVTSYSARGLGHNSLYAFANFLSAITVIVLNILILLVLKLKPLNMLWAYIIGPMISSFFIIFKERLWKYFDLSLLSMKNIKKYLKYSIPLVPNELSWWIIHASDRTVVSYFLGVSANGILAIATKFSSIYTMIFSVFNYAWTEQCFLNYNKSSGSEYISKTIENVIKLFSGLTLFIISLMPFIFKFMVNEKYHFAYNLVPLYFIAVYINVIVGLISPIYLINNETKSVANTTILAGIVNIIVHVFLINIIGLYAAPISSIIGYLCVCIWRSYDINKRYIKLLNMKEIHIKFAIMLSLCLVIYYCFGRVVKLFTLIFITIYFILTNLNLLKLFLNIVIEKIKVTFTEHN